MLSATGTGVSAIGGRRRLTISGSLSAGERRPGDAERHRRHAASDTITLNASDSFGNSATAQTIAVTVNGLPVITAPTAETIGVGKAAAICRRQPDGERQHDGRDLHGDGSRYQRAAVGDRAGVSSATAAKSADDSAASLGAVNTALGTLSDTDATAGSDTITVNASDSFGNTRRRRRSRSR